MWTPGSNSTNSSGLSPPDIGSNCPLNDGTNNPVSDGECQGGGQQSNLTFEELLGDVELPDLDFDQLLNLPDFTADALSTSSQIPDGAAPSLQPLPPHNRPGNKTCTSSAHGEAPRASGGGSESCGTCTPSRTCAPCRLKQRCSALRAENETLRTRDAGIRAEIERHDECLQDIDEKRLLSDEVMNKLWGYQENLRKLLDAQM